MSAPYPGRWTGTPLPPAEAREPLRATAFQDFGTGRHPGAVWEDLTPPDGRFVAPPRARRVAAEHRQRRMWLRNGLLLLLGIGALCLASPLMAADPGSPSALSGLLALAGDGADGRQPLSLSLQLVLLLSLLTLLPSVLLMMTGFVRILVVLAILRQALGLQQAPPNQLLVGIALFMTIFVMQPQLSAINQQALQPFVADTIPAEQAIARAGEILHGFMLANTRKADLAMFAGLAGDAPYVQPQDVPLSVLMPAFATSELKTAFQIGILLFLPFLVIDLVVATVLMALGMMMVSPMMIALPFKLMLFVAVDGWALVLSSLAQSFSGG